MTFATLITELAARGFARLSSARAGQYINDAYFLIAEQANWPWLEATTSGTAPLTISDLKAVLYVLDTVTDTKLRPFDVTHVTDWDADFTTAGIPSTSGSPEVYWLDGLTTLRVHPANTTDTLAVRYVKYPAVLTGTDTPLLPARHHSLIVDVAEGMAALRDASDERDQQNLDAVTAQAIGRLNDVYMNRTGMDGPEFIRVSAGNSVDW